jgi:predicted regulator of Ras-like GTPase activity (Roadblock/LC7/MglB family)
MDRAMLPQEWERHFGSVWNELTRLLRLSGSATAVLLDASGNAVTYAGEDPEFDLSSFASLAVGDYLATREMAALLGEEELRWVVHQGADVGLILAPLHPLLLLAVIFDHRTTLGLVRHQMRKERERLMAATRPLLQLLEQQLAAESEEPALDGTEDTVIEASLRRLFSPSA